MRHAQPDRGDRCSRPGRRPPSRCSARARGRRRSRATVRNGPSSPVGGAARPPRHRPPPGAARPLDLVEAQVVDADDLAAVDVDDLLVQQVCLEQDLVRRAGWNLSMSIVRTSAAGRRVVERLDLVQGRKMRRRSVLHDEAGHGRIAVAEGDDEVGDLADRLSLRSRTGRPIAWLRKSMCHLVGVRSALGGRARRTAPAQCRQGAGRTRVVPAGAPAGLGPVSTGGAILVRRWTPLFDERIEGPRERRPHGEPRSNGPCGGPGAYHRAMPMLRVALVQLEAGDDVDDNIALAAASRPKRPRRRRPLGRSAGVRPVPRLGRRLPGLGAAHPRTDDGAVRDRGAAARRLDPGG